MFTFSDNLSKKLLVRRLLSVGLAMLLVLILTACSSSSSEQGEDAEDALPTIKIAASATPHAEILEFAKPLLREYGYELEVTIFNDYIQPNNVVISGEFDANYFQHLPYLEEFNLEHGSNLVSVGAIHYEPFGIYSNLRSSLEEIQAGDVIAVPNDTTNEARALLLLEDNGILKLNSGAGLNATISDIEEYYVDIEIQELEAAQVSRVIDEVAYVVLNGNYALEAGYNVSTDALVYESSTSEAAVTYANIIAVNLGNEADAGVIALIQVLQSPEVIEFIETTYQGAVIPLA